MKRGSEGGVIEEVATSLREWKYPSSDEQMKGAELGVLGFNFFSFRLDTETICCQLDYATIKPHSVPILPRYRNTAYCQSTIPSYPSRPALISTILDPKNLLFQTWLLS
jgi:hypothetical protein